MLGKPTPKISSQDNAKTTSTQNSSPTRDFSACALSSESWHPIRWNLLVERAESWSSWFRGENCVKSSQKICQLPLTRAEIYGKNNTSNLRFNTTKRSLSSRLATNGCNHSNKLISEDSMFMNQTHTMRAGVPTPVTTQFNHDIPSQDQLRSSILNQISLLMELSASSSRKFTNISKDAGSRNKNRLLDLMEPEEDLGPDRTEVFEERKVGLMADPDEVSLLEVSLLSSCEILQLATCHKTKALSLQDAVRRSIESPIVEELVVKVMPLAEVLCKDPLGNYLIQALCKASQNMLRYIQSLCRTSYAKFLLNEYCSRVIQACIEVDPEYRKELLGLFSKNLKLASSNSASVFVVSACLKMCKHDSEYSFLLEDFLRKPQKWIMNRWYKRILVSLINSCSTSTVELVSTCILAMVNPIQQMFKDKYLLLLLLSMISRDHEPTIRKLSFHISKNILVFANARHFAFFLERVDLDRHHSLTQSIVKALNNKIYSLRNQILR